MVPMALGTQTGGSVIRPAAYCGTVGYKPTFQDINRNGVLPNSPSFDTVGIITRSIDDLALFRSVVLEEKIRSISPPDIATLRIAYYPTINWDKADSATHEMLESASISLKDAGASVTELTLPAEKDFDHFHKTIAFQWEFARTVAWERLNHHDQLSDDLRDGRMQNGVDTSYEQYRKATSEVEVLKQKVDKVISNYDAVLCPSALGEAIKGHAYWQCYFQWALTMLGTSSITLPIRTGPQGLPWAYNLFLLEIVIEIYLMLPNQFISSSERIKIIAPLFS